VDLSEYRIIKQCLNFGLLSALQTHIIRSPKKSRENSCARRSSPGRKLKAKI